MSLLFKSFSDDALFDICQNLYASEIIDHICAVFGKEMTPTEIIAAAHVEAERRGLINDDRFNSVERSDSRLGKESK